jgi:hypothetical protein
MSDSCARSGSNPVTKFTPDPGPLRKSGSQTADDDPAPVTLNVIAGPPGSVIAGTSWQVCRQLRLPDGQTLTVRAITQADVDGLDTLFGRLSDDEYHRFFHSCCPNQKFLEQMTPS